jgi:Fe-S cluster assembly protein SufD
MTQLATQGKSSFANKGTYLKNFTRIDKHVAGPPRPWLADLHRAGVARFEAVGFPTTDEEEWRFTNVAALANATLVPPARAAEAATKELAARFGFGAEAGIELVFVNGQFAPELSHGEIASGNVRVQPLSAALVQKEGSSIEPHLGHLASIDANPFVAMNSGLFREGAVVQLGRGAIVERPIHLLFLSAPTGHSASEIPTTHPRVLVVAEENVSASIVESYGGEAGRGPAYFTNAVTEIVAGAASHIDHCKIQHESSAAFHVATMHVSLASRAAFVSHAVSIGSKLARNDLTITMNGNAAEATLNGLVLLADGQHCDNHTLLDHAFPMCPSHELYKHVLAGRSTGVFKGKILVRPDAQKTDSKQTSKSLLLGDDAAMHSQPALEIYADDVKCTHGSTTGPVDEEMVFYLRSRGVDLETARHLLTYAFAADITRRIKIEPVRRRVEDFMAARAGLPQDLRITDLGRHDEKSR